MARPDKIASRYAKAIYDSFPDESQIRPLLAEMERFSSAVESSEDMKRVLASEVIHEGSRRLIVEDVAKKLGLSDAARRVLVVISDAKRLGLLPPILERLHVMLLEAAGVVPMKVVAATALSSDERQKVEQRFHKILGKKVEASYVVDSGLLGGLRVTAGSRTFDGTVSGWLASFEEQLAGGAI